jgi:hypothetical protein
MTHFQLDADRLRAVLAAFRPSSFETLADWDTPSKCSNKRLTKAVNRTVEFHDALFEREGQGVRVVVGT